MSGAFAKCQATLLLDFDSIYCNLEDGHPGMHEDWGDGGQFRWESMEFDA